MFFGDVDETGERRIFWIQSGLEVSDEKGIQ